MHTLRIAIQLRRLYKKIDDGHHVKGTMYELSETLNSNWHNSITGGSDTTTFKTRWRYEKHIQM